MVPTDRFWAVAGLGGVLVAIGVLAARPIALVGAAAVGAWLVTVQFRAATQFSRLDDSLTVSLTPTRSDVGVDRPLRVRLEVQRDAPQSVPVTVRAPAPVAAVGADDSARTVRLAPGETAGQATFTVQFPTAGSYQFPPATVEARDDWEVARVHLERGEEPAVRVSAKSPGDIHVGRGGESVGEEFGEHRTDRRGQGGLIPAGLRAYFPDDPASQIDWRATARLGEPYVREFETETGRRLLIVVDGRERMRVGGPGRTMLDHAREVALGVVGTAEAADDPAGLFAVGDGELTTRVRAASTAAHYTGIRTALWRLGPTPGGPAGGTAGGERGTRGASPARARALLDRLGDGEPLARVRPYLSTADAYVRRVEGDPLFRAVEVGGAETRGRLWTVIVTDDSDREAVYEAARHATGGDGHALVFLTPRVLYEPGALADLDAADERYRSFESFRRDLETIPRVTAFEVAPGDRLDALVTARRSKRDTPSTS